MNFSDVRNNRQIIKVEWIGRFTCTYSLHVSCFLRQHICWAWVWFLERSLRGIQTQLHANLQSKNCSLIRYSIIVKFRATITVSKGKISQKKPWAYWTHYLQIFWSKLLYITCNFHVIWSTLGLFMSFGTIFWDVILGWYYNILRHYFGMILQYLGMKIT